MTPFFLRTCAAARHSMPRAAHAARHASRAQRPRVTGVRNKSLMVRCGGMHVFHVDDLRRIAPLWLRFTERIREFACREPEKYFDLAAPRDGRNPTARRRQFMWMVEMYGCAARRILWPIFAE